MLAVTIGLGILFVVFTVRHQPPLVPKDFDHRAEDVEQCLSCHGRGRAHARPKTHPLNDRCWECHRRAP